MTTLLGIFTNAPIYVWPLLIALIFVGLHARKDRETSVYPMLALPLLAIAGFANLLSLPDQTTTWTSWGAAYALGAAIGFWLQSGWITWRRGMRVGLRGEWATLIMVMVIFWTSFAMGFLGAVAPDRLATAPLSILLPAIEGVGSGFFLGRVIRVLTTRSAPAAP